jgi:polyisoprenoid-binding protein YceI
MTRAPRSTPTRTATRLTILAVFGLAVLGGGAGLAYLFLRGAPPPPVVTASGSPGATVAPGTTPAPGATSAAGSAPAGGVTGEWRIDPSIGSFSDFTGSFVGYRVDETLAGNKANTAVGRTPDVIGFLRLDGSTITAVEISADLTSLVSDDSRRDGQLRNQAIQTGQFPDATFKLTQPLDLGAVPVDGATFDVNAIGELTLHGVTRAVRVPLHAVLDGDVVTVTGSIDIRFADYQIEKPTSFVVLSIEDHGTMELQLHFRRS